MTVGTAFGSIRQNDVVLRSRKLQDRERERERAGIEYPFHRSFISIFHTCSQEMDQQTANALFEKGACLLFLEAPPNLEFGIDYMAWTIGPLFKGVKMIPPGLHFVYFSYELMTTVFDPT